MDDLERLEERLTEQYPADNERQISRNAPAAADTVKQEVQETNDEQEDDFDEGFVELAANFGKSKKRLSRVTCHFICSDCRPRFRTGCATCRHTGGYLLRT